MIKADDDTEDRAPEGGYEYAEDSDDDDDDNGFDAETGYTRRKRHQSSGNNRDMIYGLISISSDYRYYFTNVNNRQIFHFNIAQCLKTFIDVLKSSTFILRTPQHYVFQII